MSEPEKPQKEMHPDWVFVIVPAFIALCWFIGNNVYFGVH